jgi:hypothetical protein
MQGAVAGLFVALQTDDYLETRGNQNWFAKYPLRLKSH